VFNAGFFVIESDNDLFRSFMIEAAPSRVVLHQINYAVLQAKT